MALSVREASAADRATWDSFVVSRPEADALQTWTWGDANAPFGERPIRFVCAREDGVVRAVALVLVRETTAARSVLYVPHGPIWDREAADADDVVAALFAALGAAGRAERGVVLKLDPRATTPDSSATLSSTLKARGLRHARHELQAPTTRIVDLLDGGEELMKTWHADARRLSRRSEREGVVVDVDRTGSAEAIAAFHQLLVATAERGDFRARSREFLERAAAGFAASSGWYTVLARSEGREIAGMGIPRIGDRAYYLYGASRKEPELRHKYGAHAAMAGALRALAADGVRTLDMWGVVEPEQVDADRRWEGFSAFKRTFGGRPLRHPGTFDLVLDPLWYRIRDVREAIRDRLNR